MENNTMDKILGWLENPFVAAIFKGVFVAFSIIMAILAGATFILAFWSPWWIICFILVSLIAGASFAVANYLMDEF